MVANVVEQGYDKIGWHPTEMIDLRHFKEVLISYRMHLPYMKQILNNQVAQNRIIFQDWKGLVTAVLQSAVAMVKEKTLNIEQQNRAREMNIVKDKLLDEGQQNRFDLMILLQNNVAQWL